MRFRVCNPGSLSLALATAALLVGIPVSYSQQKRQLDPVESSPSHGAVLPRPKGAVLRSEVDEARMRALIEKLVACGTRNTLSSWTDSVRGVGCGRDVVEARLNDIAKTSGGKLQVVVDKFEATSPRTSNKPAHLENVYGILRGSDPALSKTIVIVSGHFDSRASDVMNPDLDAPGADDDSSGVAVSMECARLLSRAGAGAHGPYRATLLFAGVSGEEQGLLGSTHMLEWTKEHGYTVAAMLDDDIVGADYAPRGPHRVRLFSGNEFGDEAGAPSRELARAIEEIDGSDAIRLIFFIDRLGRGGDHYPFYKAGLPAVRFTEPLENYNHQHQTVRTENGIEYGDKLKYLSYKFMGDVARDNAEALRQLALAPAPPADVVLSGGVTPDAKIKITADDDADRAGFEVLWRETISPRWQVYSFTQMPGEVVLKNVSTDNHFFGVRSVGKNGARSIAVPAHSEQRLPPVAVPTTPK
ncbi:MAG TPA: M28 family peptidase [Candidatus Acidoferrales bacterium]|jgi:hypothetical protein|nr:M28 family peptidase [Candidatus Acidoferrales bacterium]